MHTQHVTKKNTRKRPMVIQQSQEHLTERI